MTLNRLITTLIQIFLWLPVIWYVRELIRDHKNAKFMRK